MSVLEKEKIDIVATRPDSSVVKLVITDHLDWSDIDNHCRLLQEKINTYISFIESGQLQDVKEPPIPENPDVMISIAVPKEPIKAAKAFFKKVERFLANIGISFEIMIRPE